jgi:uncharacterized membrane protein
VLLASHQLCHAQSFLIVHAGPAFDGTTGYINPSFHETDVASQPEFGWALLNNAGTAAWLSDFVPRNVNSYAVRFQPPAGPAVKLNELAGPPITPTSAPYAINSDGAIVGTSRDANGTDRPVRWNAGENSPTVLAPLEHNEILGPPDGIAYDVNDHGIAVGWSGRTHPALFDHMGDRAVRWDAAGNVTEFGQISSYMTGSGIPVSTSEAFAINNAGQSVGHGTIYDAMGNSKGVRAVRWSAAGTPTQLGHIGTSAAAVTNAAAWAINETGAAVGYATKYDGGGLNDGLRAVRWNAGSTTAVELQLLGTDPNGVTLSKAYTLNEAGTAVGWAHKYVGGVNQGARAVTWNTTGQVTELGLLPGATESQAFDINNFGIAVGTMSSPTSTAAVYWAANGTAVDLNTLISPANGWRLERALAISETGWVAGIGKFDDGPGGVFTPYDRVFMLQLPTTVTLAGDYNANGRVDAADYVLWRRNLGSLATLPNDNTPGWIVADDYSEWRANFGRTAGAGLALGGLSSVPEPSCIVTAIGGLAAIVCSSLRRRSEPVGRRAARIVVL